MGFASLLLALALAGSGHVVYARQQAHPVRPFDLYSIAPSGADMRRITRTPTVHELDPAVSPTGARIAYTHRSLSGPFEVWVMRADGTGRHRLARGSEPAWSPDGKRIAYVGPRMPRVSKPDVWIMRSDGSHQKRLTFNRASDRSPAWSPDGKRIAFVSDRVKLGNADIWTMDPAGHNLRNLTAGSNFRETSPDWARDGRIVFVRESSQYGGSLMVMDASGANQHQAGSLSGAQPAWSRDGKSLAYTTSAGLWVAAADGSGARLLVPQLGSSNTLAVASPDWSPR